MRTVFTLEEAKRVVEGLYNGNLAEYRAKKGAVEYINENSEKILLKDEYGKELGEKDIAQYLNLHFYTWRNRVVESEGGEHFTIDGQESVAAFVKSLNGSMNDAYALVELTDNKALASQDIDAGKVVGRVTIIIQANKVALLDYYATKIRNKYLGAPQDITNSFGDIIKAYLGMGIILYDSEPTETQLGETVIVSFNFTIDYLADAFSYADTDISFYIGEEDPDELEVNPLNLHYMHLPLTKASLRSVCEYKACVHAQRPDLSGAINENIANSLTLQYFDFKNEQLVDELNAEFWNRGAIKYSTDGESWENNTINEFNTPVLMKVKHTFSDGTFIYYKYALVITDMNKDITNGEFNVNTLTLKTRALDETPYEEVAE